MSAQISDNLSGIAPTIEEMLMEVTAGRDALAVGRSVGGYVIDRVLGRDDISIAYLATEPVTRRQVEIEEYLPEAIARREDDGVVRPRSETLEAAFEAGRRAFVEEASQLEQALHPALLRVLASWQGGGTAYRVLPPLPGTTLDTLRASFGGTPSEDWLRALLLPLCGALNALHAASLVHGNVRAGNILIREDGSPLLLGFDAARWALGDMATHPEPGFLAIEQTERYGALPAGPWTDVYALGALVLYCIAGRPPPAAAQRLGAPTAQPFAHAITEQKQRDDSLSFAPALVAAVDQALMIAPGQRPRSIDEFVPALGDAPAGAPARLDVPPPEPLPAKRAAALPAQAALSKPPLAAPTPAPVQVETVARAAAAGLPAAVATPVTIAVPHADAQPVPATGYTIDIPLPWGAAPGIPTIELPPVDASDESWRAVRPGERQSAAARRGRSSRGWWFAAALPLAGIVVLGWYWGEKRHAEAVLETFRASLVGAPEPAPPPPANAPRAPAVATAPPRVEPPQATPAPAPTPPATAIPPTPVAQQPPPTAAAPRVAEPPPAAAPPRVAEPPPAAALPRIAEPPTAAAPRVAEPPTAAAPRVAEPPPTATAPRVAQPPPAAAAGPTPPPSLAANPVPPPVVATAPPTAQAPATAPAPRAQSEIGTATPAPRGAAAAAPGAAGTAPAAARAPAVPAPKPRQPEVRTATAESRNPPPAPAEANNPRAVCAPRSNFALYRCMQTQCERDRFYTHAQCIRLRQSDEVS